MKLYFVVDELGKSGGSHVSMNDHHTLFDPLPETVIVHELLDDFTVGDILDIKINVGKGCRFRQRCEE